MADPVDVIGRICDAAVLGMDKVEAKRDELFVLWVEWLDGMYDGKDLLRRVKLAVHGPLRKPGAPGVREVPPRPACTWPSCGCVDAYCQETGDGDDGVSVPAASVPDELDGTRVPPT